MAKIKSTLDIVMERTKDLTLSPKDRDALRRKELVDKVRGWIQLLVDGTYSFGNLMSDYAEEVAHSPEVRDILRRELLEHVDPDMDNNEILEAYSEVLGLDGGPVIEAMKVYRLSLGQGKEEQRERLRGVLAASGVSGSAVLPNIQADPEWKALSMRLKDRFKRSFMEG